MSILVALLMVIAIVLFTMQAIRHKDYTAGGLAFLSTALLVANTFTFSRLLT